MHHEIGSDEAVLDSLRKIHWHVRTAKALGREVKPLYLLTCPQRESVFERELVRHGEALGVPVIRTVVQSAEDWYEFREEVDYDLSGVVYTGWDRFDWWPQVLRAYPAVFDIDGVTTGVPAVVEAVLRIIETNELDESISGREVLIIGRSRYVGMPMAAAVCRRFDAIPTVMHSKMDPHEMDPLIRRHRFIISCLPHRVGLSASHIGEGSTVIDVAGTLEIPPGVEPWFDYTPQTGCIGPLTTHILLERAVSH